MQQLAISAHRDGFRRAGRAWNRAATVVAVDELTREQREQLRGDPNITVTLCAPEGAPESAPAAEVMGPTEAYETGYAAGTRDAAGAMNVAELRDWLIRAAMRGLDPQTDGHFTASGLPATAALEAATGLASITAAERDDYWARFQPSLPEKPAA